MVAPSPARLAIDRWRGEQRRKAHLAKVVRSIVAGSMHPDVAPERQADPVALARQLQGGLVYTAADRQRYRGSTEPARPREGRTAPMEKALGDGGRVVDPEKQTMRLKAGAGTLGHMLWDAVPAGTKFVLMNDRETEVIAEGVAVIRHVEIEWGDHELERGRYYRVKPVSNLVDKADGA